jgi:hypothetical protein
MPFKSVSIEISKILVPRPHTSLTIARLMLHLVLHHEKNSGELNSDDCFNRISESGPVSHT